jgi:hypothetical protein
MQRREFIIGIAVSTSLRVGSSQLVPAQKYLDWEF